MTRPGTIFRNRSHTGLDIMADKRNGTFDEDELVLVLALYKSMDRRDVRKDNPRIVRLSEFLKGVGSGPDGAGRSPGSVYMKMNNYMSLDPDYGGTGCENIGQGDKEVWDRFYDAGFCGLAEAATRTERRLAGFYEGEFLFEDGSCRESELEGGLREYMERARIERDIFRSRTVGSYNGACCITGSKNRSLVGACPIKPLEACLESPKDKLDPRNGLCLNVFHERAFKLGLFTLDDQLRVEVSPAVVKNEKKEKTILTDWLCAYDGMRIAVPEQNAPDAAYLEYHRDKIYADTGEKLRKVRI